MTVNGGGLMVSAEGSNAPQASAVGAAEANSKYSVGGAFIYGDYSLETKAWIGKNATINVDNDIEISAASSQVGGFPTSLGDFIGGVFGLRDSGFPWVGDGSVTDFPTAVDNTGGLVDTISGLVERGQAVSEGDYSFLLQEFSSSFVTATAKPGEVTDKDDKTSSKSYSASGNFDLVCAKSHAWAWIDEGVKINQNTPDADAKQSVSVEATTETKSLTFAGLTGQGNPFDFTSVGGEGAIGGVYAHHDHDMFATAYIADGVRIKANNDVTVNAENNLIVAAWDFAGASGKGFAVQGTFTVTPVTSETYAYIENTATIEADGDLTVSATTDNLFITFTGALAESQKVAVGAGLGYLDVDATTKAFIGNQTTSVTYSTPSTITVGGDTSVTAEGNMLSVLIAASGALSRTPNPEPPAPPPTVDEILDGGTLTNLFALPDDDEPTNTKQSSPDDQNTKAKSSTGFGLSASLGLNLINSITFAGIDTVTLTSGGNVEVDATSSEFYLVATGAASLNLNSKADSSTAIAGALSWNDLDRDTIAKINNATISAADVTVNADASNLLVSVTAGAAFTSPAQTKQKSVGIAGSANINDFDTTVSATITGTSKITSTGDVNVTANHDLISISLAGAAGVSQRAGAGAAFDFGFFATTVEARLGDGVQVTATGDVDVNAENTAFFASIAASIGIGTKTLGLAGSASWTNYTTNVTAAIGNNTNIASGRDLDVIADETLTIVGIGGAAGIGKDSGFGAALAGININRAVNATIGNNSVLSVTGSTTAGEHGVAIKALTDDSLYLFAAGGAVAATKAAIAGSFTLLIDNTTTNAAIGNSTTISQPTGKTGHIMSVGVTADHESNILSVAGAFALGKSAGVGLGVVVQPITHTVNATVGTSTSIAANNDVRVQANHDFDVDNVGTALAGALGGVGVAGAGVIQILSFNTNAVVNSSANLRANGNIVVTADSVYDMLAIAGNGALGVGGTGVGVSNVTTVRSETVKAEVGNNATLVALGNKGTFAAADDNSAPRAVRGVIVTSTLADESILVAAGAAGGTSGAGVAGSANVTVQTTNVLARIGSGVQISQAALDKAAANTLQQTYIYAENTADFVGAGGAGGFGSSGGIGAGVDVGVINRTTEAVLDTNAKVYSKNDVSVRAVASGEWISVAASIGIGGTSGVAGAASVQVHTINTKARIGDNSTVFSGNNVIVTARDELQLDSIAGQISVGGSAGVGGSIPVAIVTKITDASIGNFTTIDALASGAAYQTQVTPPSVKYASPLFFSKTSVNTTTETVDLGYDHGFQTGDQVTYWSNDNSGIGGLENNGNYYAIRTGATTIKLAASKSNATAGTVIDLTSQGGGTKQSIVAYSYSRS